jgi:hypothetical protein
MSSTKSLFIYLPCKILAILISLEKQSKDQQFLIETPAMLLFISGIFITPLDLFKHPQLKILFRLAVRFYFY